MVQFTAKKIKEEIITKSYKGTFRIRRKVNKILKEHPKKVIESRKVFRPLTDKFKKLKIRFRWEIPMGLSFFYKGN